MTEKKENKTVSSKLNNFLEKNRKPIITVFLVLLIAVIGFISIVLVNSSNAKKDLAKIETISYELTNLSSTLEEAELSTRIETAKDELAAFASKGGIAGVRANMILAELYFIEKNYVEAQAAWEKVAQKGKKSYTAPLAYFNIAVCCEENGDLDQALNYYKAAFETEDFVLKTHAKFSYARVLEEKEDFKAAYAAYKELFDENPDDSYAQLAKSRMISLEIENKVE